MAEDRGDRAPYPFPPIPPDLLDESWGEGEEGSNVSSFAIFSQLLRNARWVIGLPLLAFVLTAAYMSTKDQPWVARAKFLPATGPLSGGGGGVMSEISRLVGGGGGGPDALFYSFLVPSSAFLRGAAGEEYEVTRVNEEGERETVRGSLADIYGIPTANAEQEARTSLSLLQSMVTADRETGTEFVLVTVRAPWKELAIQVNNRVLDLVNEFNIEQRQTQAASEREFVGARMAEAEEELDAAEAEYVRFLDANQGYQQSPRLMYEAARLESQVQLKRTIYSSLAQSYEQARITEVRNTPVVTVVERPADTVYKPKLGTDPLRYGLMAAVLIALLTIGVLALRAYLGRQKEEYPDDFEEFRRLARDSVPDRLRRRVAELRGRENGGGPGLPAETTTGEP